MPHRLFSWKARIASGLGVILNGPQALALVPAMALGGFWLGGEGVLIALAIGLPLCLNWLKRAGIGPAAPNAAAPDPGGTGDTGNDILSARLDGILAEARGHGRDCLCILVEIDDFAQAVDRYGHAAIQAISGACEARFGAVLRREDVIIALGDGRFAAIPTPTDRIETEIALRLCARLQETLEEPVAADALAIHLSASAGFALASQIPDATGGLLASAARAALRDARRHAPVAVRPYQPGLALTPPSRSATADAAIAALHKGDILPWFQPQISTDTGRITGFEALARWIHPERGLIPPAEFLPALEHAGQMKPLGEIILSHTLNALKAWDRAGLDIPRAGINLSADELRNPKLVEAIAWELDRFDLTPGRLMIEILETVVATSPGDMAVRNIRGLSALGCAIDLDDFGTGQASITSIRRFGVDRIKIDRSFVMKVDRDPEQQRMISAILMLADQLDLDTLAEGVETAGEHAMLAQLGCRHVQGFGICRPIPFDKTVPWATAHLQKLGQMPVPGRKTG